MIIDSVVLRVLRTNMVKAGDFVTDPGPPISCTCTREALRTFIAAYERRMLTLFTHPGAGRRIFLPHRPLAAALGLSSRSRSGSAGRQQTGSNRRPEGPKHMRSDRDGP